MQYFARYIPKTGRWLVYVYPRGLRHGRISLYVIDDEGNITFEYTVLNADHIRER